MPLQPNFEEFRCEVQQKFEESQSYVVEDDVEEADNPSSFMKMIRARTDAALSAKDEERQLLSSWVIWDGNLDRFQEQCRRTLRTNWYRLPIDLDFQESYLEKGVDCFVDFLDEVHSASQIKRVVCALYGALLSACQSGLGRRILMENRGKKMASDLDVS